MLCAAAGAVPYLVLHNLYISALVGTGGLVYFVVTNMRLNLEGKSFGKNVLYLRSDRISLSSGCPLFTPLSLSLARRVIREDGQPLTVRTLVMQSIIQSVLTGFLGVNFWWSLIDEKKRCLHNSVTGTIVVDEN